MNNRSWHILLLEHQRFQCSREMGRGPGKIEESACSVLCLQETKKEHVDISFIRKFAPRRFDSYDFIPSNGASGGILVI